MKLLPPSASPGSFSASVAASSLATWKLIDPKIFVTGDGRGGGGSAAVYTKCHFTHTHVLIGQRASIRAGFSMFLKIVSPKSVYTCIEIVICYIRLFSKII